MNIPASNAPMFISLGFDDNSHSGMSNSTSATGGVKWIAEFTKNLKNPQGTGNSATFDGTPVRCSFYSNSYYMDPYNGDYASLVKWSHNYAYRLGHEMGNHTHSHLTGGNGPTLSASAWEAEIKKCSDRLTLPAPAEADSLSLFDDVAKGAGVAQKDIVGFRAPYLRYGNGMFQALKSRGMTYDCSIEEGLDPSQDGTNFYWPYTLDHMSPGHRYMVDEAGTKEDSYFKAEHPELWELPCYAVIAPKDEDCEKYGIPKGFRKKLENHFKTLGKPGSFSAENGKLTGLDYNLYYFQEFNLSKAEALAVLKNTLDLRMKGNRCPLLLGVHSQYYTSVWNSNAPNCSDAKDRQAIIEEFVAYALKTYPDVRIVTMKDVKAWCENPKPLRSETTATITATNTTRETGITATGTSLSIRTTNPITVEIYALNGEKLAEQSLLPIDGICSWDIKGVATRGTYITKIGTTANTIHIH